MTGLVKTKNKASKKLLFLSLILILLGFTFITKPSTVFGATSKQSNLLYLYPLTNNNPVQPYGLFFSENLSYGIHPLNVWQESFKDKRIVVGVPEQMQISQAMIGKNLGDYVVAKISKRIKNETNKKDPPNKGGKKDSDVIFIERQVGDVTEKIRIEIGNHLSNSEMANQLVDALNKGLLPKEFLEKELDKNKPIPKETSQEKPQNNEANTMVFGGTMLLGGLALLAKVLIFAL